MSCEVLREQFSAYLDGELPAAEAQAVREHVARCAACARELGELRRMIAAFGELPEVHAPAGLKARILAKLKVGQVGGEGRRGVSRMRMWWPAAAAVVIGAALAWQGGMFGSRGARRTEVAQVRQRLGYDKDAAIESADKLRLKAAPDAHAGGGRDMPTVGETALRETAPRAPTIGPAPAEKGDGEEVLIAGTWSVLSGDPAAARARVASLFGKRRLKDAIEEQGVTKRLLADKEDSGARRRDGGIEPLELEVTRAEWAGLVAALKEEGMTPVRGSAAQKKLRAEAMLEKGFGYAVELKKAEKGAVDEYGKQVQAEESEARMGRQVSGAVPEGASEREAGRKLEAANAKSAAAEALSREGAYRERTKGEGKVGAMDDKVTDGLAAKAPGKAEAGGRFKVRLVFLPATADAAE